MTNVKQLLLVGVAAIAAVYVFRFQERFGQRIVSKVRSGDPESIVVALAMTVGLGLVVVIAASAFRKVR